MFPGSTASWSPVQQFCHKSPGLHILFSDEETFLLSWYVSKWNCGFVDQRILINFRDVWETAKTLSLWCGIMHRRAMAHYFLPRSLPVPQHIQTYWSSLFLLKWWSYLNSHLPGGWYSTQLVSNCDTFAGRNMLWLLDYMRCSHHYLPLSHK